MTKIPGTESTEIKTPEDFERYARSLADDPETDATLALRLLGMAGEDVRRTTGAWVTVHTYDGRPAYLGTVRATRPTRGRYEVYNPETTEIVAVPASAIAPYGAAFDCDCSRCLGIWEAVGLQ